MAAGFRRAAPSDVHPYDDDVVLLGVDDFLGRSGHNTGQLLGADLDGTAVNGASSQGDCAEPARGAAHGLVVRQEGRLDGSSQVCPLVLQGLDLLVESGELGVALGGELPAGRTDLGLLLAEALRLLPGGVERLHGHDLRLLQG